MATFPTLGVMLQGGLVFGLPVWTQPGGPGTQVFPQQQLGEMVAFFVMPFCNHWSNHVNVIVQQSAPGVLSALITCPLCTMVVRILTPFTLYLDNTVNYIILP